MSGTSGAQHLLDCLKQPIAVSQHDVVKLAPLFFADVARLQRFEIQTNRSDRRLQLVRDGVDERVVLLVASYLADQERRVEHESEDQHVEKDDAENEQRDFTPVKYDSPNVQRDRKCDETRAERDEKHD